MEQSRSESFKLRQQVHELDEGLREAESERDEALRYAPIAIIIKTLNSIFLSTTVSLTAVEKLSLTYKPYCHCSIEL